MKRSHLKRSGALRRRRKSPRPAEDFVARAAWKEPRSGFCECCGRFSMHLEGHHVISQEHIKREGRWDLLWDPRNRMMLHPTCHANHTSAYRRVRIEWVPTEAMAFAVDLLGEVRASDYLRRFYNCEVTR